MVVRQVGRLPLQVRQGGGEVDRVLAGAAADFQDAATRREVGAQDREDGVAVAGGGWGVWEHSAIIANQGHLRDWTLHSRSLAGPLGRLLLGT